MIKKKKYYKNLKLKTKNLNKNCVLAIDPGFGRCGWAVLAKNENNESRIKNYAISKSTIHNSQFIIQLLACDLIETDKRKNLPERLLEIYKAVDYLIKKYQPRELAIESLFWFKNKKTAMAVAQARGVIIVAAKNNQLDIYEYTPLQVKQAVVGYGKADKTQVQKMIRFHLDRQSTPIQDDTADAVAIGLTHLQTNRFGDCSNTHENCSNVTRKTIFKREIISQFEL